jgi:hypothetical protein
MCVCTYSNKLLWELWCQCPLCSSGEAIDDWQGWTGMFLLDLIAMLFVCCLTLCSQVVNLIKYPLMPEQFKFFEFSTPKCTVTF